MLYWKMVRAAFTFTSVRHPTFPWFICTQANEQKRVSCRTKKELDHLQTKSTYCLLLLFLL